MINFFRNYCNNIAGQLNKPVLAINWSAINLELFKFMIYIDCIGVDNKIHVCEPHLDDCLCGIKIKSKKIQKNDRVNRFYCYICDGKWITWKESNVW